MTQLIKSDVSTLNTKLHYRSNTVVNNSTVLDQEVNAGHPRPWRRGMSVLGAGELCCLTAGLPVSLPSAGSSFTLNSFVTS